MSLSTKFLCLYGLYVTGRKTRTQTSISSIMNEDQMTKSQLKKEILDEFNYLSPTDLIKIFEMIFGSGQVELNEVDWSK